jgi:putative transposase
MNRASYPTDLTNRQSARIEHLVPGPKAGGRPAKHDRLAILNAILYLVRTGCAWRLLPHDLPPWKTVYHYFRCWRLDGTWKRIHDELRGDVREAAGRKRQPSAAIIDSQSVKTTERGARTATMRARRSMGANAICW